ncbi:MAG: translation initiation factor IF-2 [Patescibacteria group bacterium]
MKKKNIRPPIVVVLGHVDHGKTSLLDYIRKSRIALREAGGITQSIGASQVVTKSGKKITFIDTPGHAAFNKMRSRGAKVADVAILIVASDAGVQPQTKEAIDHIRESELPYIVVLTKVDLQTANTEFALDQLEKEGILLEKRGGDIPWIEVSAKTGKGVDDLLETISLLADVTEIEGDLKKELEAVVIETSKDQSGPLVNVIVRNGSIKVGETLYIENGSAKVRNLKTDKGNVKEVFPGDPVQILGFDLLPEIGTKLFSTKFDNKEKKETKKSYSEIHEDQIGVIIKAQNTGCLEAILNQIPKEIVVIDSGIGDINESDVLLAKTSESKTILSFESKVSNSVLKLAESEGVTIHSFKVIYELFQTLEKMVEDTIIEIIGKAEIVDIFPFNKKKIAGCKVLQGKINKDSKLKIIREEIELGDVKAISLKKQKQEVTEVGQGEEFGILFSPQLDFIKGDMLVSVAK